MGHSDSQQEEKIDVATETPPGHEAQAKSRSTEDKPTDQPTNDNLNNNNSTKDNAGKKKWYRGKAPPPPPETLNDAIETPLAKSNLLTQLTFGWLDPMMSLGFKRPLEENDMWRLDNSREIASHVERFNVNLAKRQAQFDRRRNGEAQPGLIRKAYWNTRAHLQLSKLSAVRYAELETNWRERDLSIMRAIFDTFPGLIWHFPWRLIADVLAVTQPLVMKEIIKFSQEMYAARHSGLPGPSMGKGIGLAFGLFLMSVVEKTFADQFFFRMIHNAILVRSTLISSMFGRVFHLTPAARSRASPGKLMTHVSADISRIEAAFTFFHLSWISLVVVTLVVILLCLQIGASGVIGFLVFVVLTPMQMYITQYTYKMRKTSTVFTEQRTKLLNGLLTSMGVVKMFTYEIPYINRLRKIRTSELSSVRKIVFVRCLNEAIADSVPTLASVFAFIMYSSLNGNQLNAAIMFPSLSLLNELRNPLMFIPHSFSMMVDAYNGLKRLNVIFRGETMDTRLPVDPSLDVAIRTVGATFQWETVEEDDDAAPKTSKEKRKEKKGKKAQKKAGVATDPPTPATPTEPFSVRNLNLDIPRGQLVTIVGPVGSGKSSVLQGLLGQMRPTGGTVQFGGRLGYCQQTAWIQNATVRDNIVFGQTWDEERYWRVVEDASLMTDLELLPDGDLTEIGEKGINLSGGQKQRINIARALYFNADILLLDDPLSAVDAHVGRALFSNAILGLRRAGKTVVLVTHALHFLPQVDRIFTVEDGQVVEEGTYTELMGAGGEFKKLMESFGGGDHDQVEDKKSESDDSDTVQNAESEEGDEVKKKEDSKAVGTGKAEGHLIVAEERKTGGLGAGVYMAYFRAGKMYWLVISLVLGAVMQVAFVMSTFWITYWEEDKYKRAPSFYQGIYALLGVITGIFTLIMGMATAMMCINASKVLYLRALHNVFFSPMSFFYTTPIGRIMGIFGKDVDMMDDQVGEFMRPVIFVIVGMIGSIIVIAVNFPYFIAVAVVVGAAYGGIAWYYRSATREIKRIEGIVRGRMYSHFGESISGLATIHAYGETDRFIRENAERLNQENRSYILSRACPRWLSVRLGWCGSVLVLAIALMCTAGGATLSPGQIGLCLSYMSMITGMLTGAALLWTMLGVAMTSVERIQQYSGGTLPQEAAYELPEPKQPWPSAGNIQLQDVVMSYREGLPPVLKGINVNFAPGERVGIVGRTGAGKTSITVALYRLSEMSSGRILIDGVDVSTLGLKNLRQAMSIIPQDPELFRGTLRSNLDPFEEHNDSTLNDVLERACLRDETVQVEDKDDAETDGKEDREDKAEKQPPQQQQQQRFTLDMAIDDGGSNLSVGQRSLVSLARALLKDVRIMVLDEATSAVDLETDAKIQKAIRDDCNRTGKTLLCIAHRLRTVIGWDKILVMDAGSVHDFGSPLELFDQPDGLFRTMCDRSNITRDEIVRARSVERT